MITTKISIPNIEESIQARINVLQKLSAENIRRLILISAPSGYGKTVSAVTWLKHQNLKGAKIAWVSLDQWDNDANRFFTYVLTSLNNQLPGLFDDMLTRLTSPFLPPMDWIVGECIFRIDNSEAIGKVILILDDYHHIIDRMIMLAIEQLITYCPSKLTIVLISRERTKLPLASMRSKGWLTELGIEDLAFSTTEAKDYLEEKLVDTAVSTAEQQAQIMAYINAAEGWIAGLQMASISGFDDYDRQSDKRHYDHSSLMASLTQTVFDTLSLQEKHLLMITSAMPQFSVGLAHLLLESVNQKQHLFGEITYSKVEKILIHFLQKNLFIITLGDKREWFRYHQMFSKAIGMHLDSWLKSPEIKESGITLSSLHRVASGHFLDCGMELEALQHAIWSGDIDHITDILRFGQIPLLYRGATTMALDWLQTLPKHELDSRPWLWMMIAASDFYLGRTNELEYRLRQTEKAMSQNLDPNHTTFKSIQAHIASLKAVYYSTQHVFDKAIEQSHQALSLSETTNYSIRCSALWSLGYSHMSLGQFELAKDFLIESRMMSQQCGHVLMWIMSTISYGKLHQILFDYDGAINYYHEVLNYKDHRSYPVTCDLYLELATIHLNRGALASAEYALADAAMLVDQIDHTDRKVRCLVLKAKIQGLKGDYSLANVTIEKAEQVLKQEKYNHRLQELKHEQGLILMRQGNLVVVEVLLQLSYSKRIAARVLALKGDAREAIRLLEELISEETAPNQVEQLVEDLVYHGVTCYRNGNMQKAATSLHRALDLLQSNAFILPFLEAGHVTLELIQKSSVEPLYPSLVKAIRSVIEASCNEEQNAIVEHLTPREMDVLMLISEGLSNEEIAGKLFLALSSVKGVNQRIFSKLQVLRRTEAVAKAKNLGWIN